MVVENELDNESTRPLREGYSVTMQPWLQKQILGRKYIFFSSLNSGSVATTVLRNIVSLTKKEAAQKLKEERKETKNSPVVTIHSTTPTAIGGCSVGRPP